MGNEVKINVVSTWINKWDIIQVHPNSSKRIVVGKIKKDGAWEITTIPYRKFGLKLIDWVYANG